MGLVRAIENYRIRRHLAAHGQTVIVASLGRAGSTLLHDALVKAMVARYVPQGFDTLGSLRAARKFATDLEKVPYRPGTVLKTHDFPSYVPPKRKVQAIYTFADPIDIMLSLVKRERDVGAEWITEHFLHFRADPNRWPRRFDEDVFGLERQFDAWMKPQAFPMLAVHYDALWDCREQISDFLGVKVTLPERKERAAATVDVDVDTMQRLQATYGRLQDKIASVPRLQVFE